METQEVTLNLFKYLGFCFLIIVCGHYFLEKLFSKSGYLPYSIFWGLVLTNIYVIGWQSRGDFVFVFRIGESVFQFVPGLVILSAVLMFFGWSELDKRAWKQYEKGKLTRHLEHKLRKSERLLKELRDKR